jgi:hypothetical protein
MNRTIRWAVYTSIITLTACAQTPVRYNPAPSPVPPPATRTIPPPPSAAPETITSANSKIVNKNRDNLWRSVSSALSQSRFAVTSVDYKTGVMQLRYAGDPRNYIDCGRVNSKVGERNFDFTAASAYQQYQILSQGKTFNVDRRMNLEAQIVLSLQPLDATRTSARVETRYGVKRDQYVTPTQGGAPFNASDSVSFMFNESATFPNAATRCTATLQLENELMQLVR